MAFSTAAGFAFVPPAFASILLPLGVDLTTGVLRAPGDERRLVLDVRIIINTLAQLADDRIRRLVAPEIQLRQRDQPHDGRFVALELPNKHITPMLDRRGAISMGAAYPRLTS